MRTEFLRKPQGIPRWQKDVIKVGQLVSYVI